MTPTDLLTLAAFGLLSGILAGFLGIGGGTVLVPMLVALGYEPVQAVATSNLAIVITSLAGSIQNWRMGFLDLQRVIYLGLPALLTAQLGVYLAAKLPDRVLLLAFGLLLLSNIYLIEFRQRVVAEGVRENQPQWNPTLARIATGGTAGVLAGVFGVGGGIIMVPLQILLLGEPLKRAIQTSLGAIVLTTVSATFGHALQGNVAWLAGILLGGGGLLGTQFSTRTLPKLSDRTVSLLFRTLLAILAIYIFWQAFQFPFN